MATASARAPGRVFRLATWTPLALLSLGVASILMLVASHRIGVGHVRRDAPLDGAVADLRLSLANSHLWLEEHLSGDTTVDLEHDVWGELDAAERIARAFLEGGPAGARTIDAPLDEPAMRLRTERILASITDFRTLAETRLQDFAEAGVGSRLDADYDAAFRDLLGETEQLERQIVERMLASHRRAMLLFGAILVAWTLVVGLAVTGLAQRERSRRRAEGALADSEDRLRTTLESIGDAVITTDLDGTVTFMNSAAEDLTGWLEQEALGRPLAEVYRLRDPETGEPVRSAHQQAVGDSPVRGAADLLLERRDGLRIPIEETAAPIRRRSGETGGIVLGLRDVSERRQAEEALKESEAQLRQSQKLEALGRLAGGMAHDVNNYLATISNECAVVKLLRGDDRLLAERMEGVIDAVERTSALIRRLLAFSRRQPTRLEVVDLNRVAAGLEEMLRRLIGEDVVLTLRSDPDLWSVRMDPSQIEQILVNLLANAREAMPRGGTVTVRTGNVRLETGGPLPDAVGGAEVEPGDYVILTVEDDGSGIDPAIRDQIFEPFFTTRGERGSGLGLPTVYGIVRQTGGFLRLASAPGRGTTFRIYLPRCREEAPALPAVAGTDFAPRPPRSILLVEDNAALRASTASILAALGHRPTVAENGEEALSLYRTADEPFDLLITDLLMPGKTGKEVAEAIWEHQRELPVVFVSGFADRVAVEEHLERPHVGFLAKPFTLQALEQALERAMPIAGACRATAVQTPAGTTGRTAAASLRSSPRS